RADVGRWQLHHGEREPPQSNPARTVHRGSASELWGAEVSGRTRAGERRWRSNPSARQGVDHRPGFDVSDQGKSGCRADNTYGNEEMLRWLDDRGITPYIRVKEGPNSPPDLYGIEKFTYVPEENCYLCPAGKPLNYVGINKRNRAHRYYSTVKRFRGCGQKPQCTRGKFRTIAIHTCEAARQKADEVAKTPEFAVALRKRRKVEALFSELKNLIGLRRLRLRRIKFVREQFYLAAVAQNLKRL